MSQRTVHCAKLGRELPGLARPPFPGKLGRRIYENVSQQGWEMWQAQSTILINHYGLNMADPNAQDFLMQQMEEFFFGLGAQLPEDWVPEGQGGGKGAPTKGAPAGKGGPAPRK
ncbi:MAG: oxidative damage protection protein [Chloroflexi bacterium]|nr:oxidative damage protection protein [Chloroflexota bacterium]